MHSLSRTARSRRRLIVLSAVIGLMPLSSALADITRQYVGPGSGNNNWWNLADNWSPQGQPEVGDTALVTYNATSIFDTTRTVRYWNTAFPNAVLERVLIEGRPILGSNATMILEHGLPDPLQTNYLDIGEAASSRGVYNHFRGNTTIGLEMKLGRGPLSFGTYNLEPTGGPATLTGTFLGIGEFGTGTFNQTGGSHTLTPFLFVPATAVLGVNASGRGTYNLSGGSFNTNVLTVGQHGLGTFNHSGGTISSVTTRIARHTGSAGTMVLSNSAVWNNSGSLLVGGDGTLSGGSGFLRLEGGARATIGGIARLWNDATISIADSGTRFNARMLDIRGGTFTHGAGGTGTVISDSGSLDDVGLHLGVGSGTGTITVDNGRFSANTHVWIGSSADGRGLFTASGDQTVVNIGPTQVGHLGRGTMTVSGGAQVFGAQSRVGWGQNASGTVTITGPGSRWRPGQLDIGIGASGRVDVQDQGLLSAFGVMNVFGRGTLTIGGEGRVTADRLSITGHVTRSLGGLVISDSGTTSLIGTFIGVGDGHGSLTISGSGSLTDGLGHNAIAFDAASTGQARVHSGGQWLTGTLDVARGGQGTLLIESGGQVSSAHSHLATNSGAVAHALVTGAGSVWNTTGAMHVGGRDGAAGGAAMLRIEDNGAVHVTDTMTVWNDGAVQYNSGTVTTGAIDLRGGGRIALSTGANKVLRTAAVTIDTAAGSHIDLADNGMIVDYDGASPIQSIRALLQSGRAGGAWSGGGINSADAGSFGIGYIESAEKFASFPATFMGHDVNATTVLLQRARYGDANLDGQVNLADFNALAANFGAANAVWSMGDFNYDGFVNLADFNLLAANFGLSASGPDGPSPDDWSALAAAVPEPSALTMLMGAALAGVQRRRRHGQPKRIPRA